MEYPRIMSDKAQLVLTVLALFLHNPTLSQAPGPGINDPFPDDVGPEPPATTVGPYTGCPAECSSRLDEAMHVMAELARKISDLNITVISKLNTVSGGGNAGNSGLSSRLSQVESYLYQNITATTDKLSTDLFRTSSTLSQQLSDTRSYIDSRLETLSSIGSTTESSSPVFQNITNRLDDLENRKVRLLIHENNIWRKNFEVVNKTFSKLRKSKYSNEVIVVG